MVLLHRNQRGKKPPTWRIFSLKELHSATNNFNYDNKLGEGGFGSVYWGQLWDGSQVIAYSFIQIRCAYIDFVLLFGYAIHPLIPCSEKFKIIMHQISCSVENALSSALFWIKLSQSN